jgi:hypothetical protein
MSDAQGAKRGRGRRGEHGESIPSSELEGNARRAGRLEGDVGVSVVDGPISPTLVETLPELELRKRVDPVERANPEHAKEIRKPMGAVAHPEGVAARLAVDGEDPLREWVADQVLASSLDDGIEPEAAPGEACGERRENDRRSTTPQDRVGKKPVEQDQGCAGRQAQLGSPLVERPGTGCEQRDPCQRDRSGWSRAKPDSLLSQ